MKELDQRIRQFVYRVRGRLREQKIVDSLFMTVGIGLGFGVILSLISLFVPFYYAVPLAAGIVFFSFFTGIVIGIKHTPSPMEAALLADAKGHKEKLSTAFYLKGKDDAFSMLQKKDAVAITESFPIRKEFPLRFPVKRALIVFGLAVLFVVSSLLETPARNHAVAKHDVKKEVKEEIAKLEQVEKSIKDKKEISENESAEIKEQLEMAKKELSEAGSKKEIKKAKDRITKKMEMASEKTGNKTLSETLSKAAKERKEQDVSKQKELAKEAREAMKKAEKGSSKDKKEAYKKLGELAETLDDQSLQKAAEEYKQSDYSDSDYVAAKNALNEVLASMEGKNANLANNNSSNNASQNNNQNSSSSQNNSQNGQNSNNQSNNNQNGNNQGSNNQNGNQQGNSGQNSNNGKGGQGQGNQSGGQGSNGGNGAGSGWNRGSKDGREGARKTNENITVPDGETGNDENLTGKANGNNTSTKEKSNQAKTWSGNKVDYGQVSGKYKDKAYKKIDGSNYPGKLKDKIKNYFDGLN